MRNNPVAKFAYQFNKPKVQPNKKKINIREYYHDEDDDYTIEYVSPDGDVRFEVLDNISDDSDVILVRRQLMNLDCTFIKIYKNDVELL